MHSGGCSYEISYEGSQESNEVCVIIKNQLKPLPIIGFISSVFGMLNENQCFLIQAESSQELKPS